MRPGPPPYDRSIVSAAGLERSNGVPRSRPRNASGGLAWARRSGAEPDLAASAAGWLRRSRWASGRMRSGGPSSRWDGFRRGRSRRPRYVRGPRFHVRAGGRACVCGAAGRRSWGTPIGRGCSAGRSRRSTGASWTASCSTAARCCTITASRSRRGRDFTLGSADRTFACATCARACPGARWESRGRDLRAHDAGGEVERDGVLGCYVQWGAMVDGAGLRVWDVAPANVQEIVRRHPASTSSSR